MRKKSLVAPFFVALVVMMGCTKTANPEYTDVQKTNNPPMANKEYTNQAVPTNQLGTNR